MIKGIIQTDGIPLKITCSSFATTSTSKQSKIYSIGSDHQSASLKHSSQEKKGFKLKDKIIDSIEWKPSYQKLNKSNSDQHSKKKIQRNFIESQSINNTMKENLTHCPLQEINSLILKPPSKPKHRRNQTVFTSNEYNDNKDDNKEANELIIQTIKKSQEKPTLSKVQYVDDFSEDIDSLADKVDKEHKKESIRNQFHVAQGFKNLQIGNFLNDYNTNHLEMEEIQEEAEGGIV